MENENVNNTNQNDPPIEGGGNPLVDKILKEKKNAMEKLRMLEQENLTFKAKLSEYEENKLVEEKKFVEIAEKRKQEADQWKAKYDESQRFITESIKTGAVKNELIKLGIDPKYSNEAIRLIDLGKIHYDNETKTVVGAEDEAKILYEKFPPLFGTQGARASHDAPASKTAQLTLEEWKKLPYEERKKREGDLYTSLGITRKR
jgi:hypothetical protein